ncbi:hypothetical protein DM02DRAFT_416480 [Periconia macrospinosa]|uniref:Uncharacterized protein n=1 Tax=Periconia macrospinosa TaxID=97972 RepID=A0A2V1DNF2_9PLEO|nr:hypothetical protein DM02DRAFT_416480 [Periconia macrospinosa]
MSPSSSSRVSLSVSRSQCTQICPHVASSISAPDIPHGCSANQSDKHENDIVIQFHHQTNAKPHNFRYSWRILAAGKTFQYFLCTRASGALPTQSLHLSGMKASHIYPDHCRGSILLGQSTFRNALLTGHHIDYSTPFFDNYKPADSTPMTAVSSTDIHAPVLDEQKSIHILRDLSYYNSGPSAELGKREAVQKRVPGTEAEPPHVGGSHKPLFLLPSICQEIWLLTPICKCGISIGVRLEQVNNSLSRG